MTASKLTRERRGALNLINGGFRLTHRLSLVTGLLCIARDHQRLRQSEHGYGNRMRKRWFDEQPMLRPYSRHHKRYGLKCDMTQQFNLRVHRPRHGAQETRAIGRIFP